MVRRLLVALAFALLGTVAVVATGRWASRRFLYRGIDLPARSSPAGFVVHVLRARDDVVVHALELPGPPGARTVVVFHNNRETAEASADLAQALHARGLGVLLVEYRGYGASRGTEPSEQGLYRDAEAVLDLLRARGQGRDRIVLWGTSLGTGVAAEMARRGRGDRLVLVTPYTSIPELVTDVVPFLPVHTLVADAFDTIAKAGDIRVPTLVIHGDADEIVPFSMGERVTRAIRGARLVRVPGGHHGDLFARDAAHLFDEVVALGS
jgi:fermentation-respiration switch protein FrsA (DUF1100 family)